MKTTQYTYAFNPAEPPQGIPDMDAITAFLSRMVATDPRNALPEGEHLTIWNAPLVGVAAADDPLFETLKTPGVVGPEHRSPGEWLPGAKSVISYFLPYTEPLRRGYPKKSPLPSLEWVSGRTHGEVFNNVIRRALFRLLEHYSAKALAPGIQLHYQAPGMIPMWSERHTAFIAGLGSFGIHGALITKQGASGRIGSIITDLELPPTPREYSAIYEYCPYPAHGTCGACIPRCPADAINPESRDNLRCVIQSRDTVGDFFRPLGYHSCGHCLTWLPCAQQIPPAHMFRAVTKKAISLSSNL
ncbi:(Fe-S)-binding protein [Betaproteobacteria bacterium]|nr:(Fe-S)-binding protein [Betaproteobacteria bacterium]GHU27797.1 (Fe-S)-binding protein [Betaproteobacteria bacterium]